jgi:hypothetical protein
MTPNHRKVLQLCIENGVKLGLMRAHKHTETPDREVMADVVEQMIWQEIDEFFDWQQEVQ